MTERFELLSQLGKGGMGTVWKARDSETGEIIALKLLHEQYASDPYFIERFEREVEVTRRIESPYVVKMLGYGDRQGRPYLAMEYIDGPSLKDLNQSEGPMSWDRARPLLRQVTLGLEAAERAGVVHRDIKPSNILIDVDGTVRLVDFGIAKAADMAALTGTSTTLGTPTYMAPEGKASPQADLYGLGCVAFEMLTGLPPFTGDSQGEIVVKHIRDAPDVSKLPQASKRTIGWLLEKDPKRRPSGAAALVAVLDGTGSAPRGAGALRRPAVYFAGPAVVGVMGIIGVFLMVRGGGGDDAGKAAGAGSSPTSGITASATERPTPFTPTTAATKIPMATETAQPPTPPVTATMSAATPGLATAAPTTESTTTPPPSPPARPPSVIWEYPTSTTYYVPSSSLFCWLAVPHGDLFDLRVLIDGSVISQAKDTADDRQSCLEVNVKFTGASGAHFRLEATHVASGMTFTRDFNVTFKLIDDYVAGAAPRIVSATVQFRTSDAVTISVRWEDLDADISVIEYAVRSGDNSGLHDSYAVSLDPGISLGGSISRTIPISCGTTASLFWRARDARGQTSPEVTLEVPATC
ncbi:MAG: serine/threonine-protein kinase [Anaerolineaceae bacterium]